MNLSAIKQKQLIFGAVVVVLGLALWAMSSSPKPPVMPFPGVTILPNPLTLTDFELTDHKGQAFSNNQLKGQWSLMFFGYTHCPDVCPTTLAMLNKFYKKQPTPNEQNIIFVTTDPIRDNVEIMADHINYYNESFVGLTAKDVPTIKKFGEEVGVIFDYEDPKTHNLISDYTTLTPESKYAVEHNASVFIFDPKGRLVADILPPHTVERVEKTFNLVKKYY